MRNSLRLVASLLVALFALTACGGASTSTKAPAKTEAPAAIATPAAPAAKKALKVGYLNVMDDAQAMLAKDAGLYEQQGLDVELVLFSSGTDLIKALVGGKLDAGVLGFTNAVSWAAQGADLKVVGGAQMGYHSILVRKDSEIMTVADLKGKRLASQKAGSTADLVLNGVVLPQANLARADLTMVYVEPAQAVQSLAAGQVDAAFVFEPYEQIAKTTLEAEAIYEIGKVWPFPCMVVITTGQELKDDRDAIDRLLTAQKQAMEMMREKPKEAAHLIYKRFVAEGELTGPSGKVPAVELIQKAIETQKFHWDISEDDIKRMEEIVTMMMDQGALKQPVEVRSLLDLTWQQSQPTSAKGN